MCQSFVSEEFCCPHNRYDSYINQVLIASMSHIMKWLLRGIGTVLKWLLKPIFKDFCLRSPLQFIWYLNTTFLKLLLKGLGQSWDTLAASRLKYIIVRHITSSVKRMYCQVLFFFYGSVAYFFYRVQIWSTTKSTSAKKKRARLQQIWNQQLINITRFFHLSFRLLQHV